MTAALAAQWHRARLVRVSTPQSALTDATLDGLLGSSSTDLSVADDAALGSGLQRAGRYGAVWLLAVALVTAAPRRTRPRR